MYIKLRKVFVHTLLNHPVYELGWDVLPHPPYSPDIAPSDYHLFLSLQNSLQGKSFIDLEDVKKHIENFFSSKPAKFYADGIFKLPDRWTKLLVIMEVILLNKVY